MPFHRSFTPLLFLLVAAAFSCGKSGGENAEKGNRPVVDDDWMEQALQFDFEGSANDLVHAFRSRHSFCFDSLDGEYPENGYFNILSVNIDGDPEAEHFLTVGENMDNCNLFLVDRRKGQWIILFYERMYGRNERPDFEVLNVEVPQKTVRIRTSLGSGNGAFGYTDTFYKMTDGVFREVLSVPAYVAYSNGVGINQRVTTRVTPAEFPGDTLSVRCAFSFYPNVYDAERLYESCGAGRSAYNRPLVADTVVVMYGFDRIGKRYRCVADERCLSTQKMEAMMRMGDYDAFAAAFREELLELLKSGDPCARNAAEYFLHYGIFRFLKSPETQFIRGLSSHPDSSRRTPADSLLLPFAVQSAGAGRNTAMLSLLFYPPFSYILPPTCRKSLHRKAERPQRKESGLIGCAMGLMMMS